MYTHSSSITLKVLLTNYLTNNCREISKMRMNFWMSNTSSVKGLEEVENMGRTWMYFASALCIVDQVHQRWAIAVDQCSKFEVSLMVHPRLMGWHIENVPILITNLREKEEKVIVWTWEKAKWKTEKFFKNYLSRWTIAFSTIRAGRARTVKAEDMNFPELGNWSTITENTATITR